MMKRRIEKALAVLLTLSLLCAPAQMMPARAEEGVIVVRTAADLLQLAQDCTLDSWSVGKRVELADNINLSGTDFKSIPTFGGHFDGCGHTITGLALAADDPVQGLFRYIQKSGVVENVTVYGYISAAGSNNTFGGIAGVNNGVIRNCRFRGSINGTSMTGGICGINETTGQIHGATAQGVLLCQKYTGGIAGKNFGLISDSVNGCSINISANEQGLAIEEISAEQLLGTDQMRMSKTTDLRGHTDTGGIAGYSTGIVTGCVNQGAIGYQHMGYNIGGIVGRQSGYLHDCVNRGTIYGRKDVGGIVGQMEPYIILRDSTDVLAQLEEELSKLQRMVNKTLDDVDGVNDTVSGRIDAIIQYTDAAKDSSHQLVGQSADFLDENIAELNAVSTAIGELLDQAEPIFGDLRQSAYQAKDAAVELSEGLYALDAALGDTGQALRRLEDVAGDLRAAGDEVIAAMERVDAAVALLRQAVSSGDQEIIDQALQELRDAAASLSKAMHDAGVAVGQLSEILREVEDWGSLLEQKEAILQAVDELSAALAEAGSAAGTITSAVETLLGQVDWELVRQAADEMQLAFGRLQAAAQRLADGFADLGRALGDAQAAADDFARAAAHLAKAVTILGDTADTLGSAMGRLGALTRDLANREPVQFQALGGAFRESSSALYAALGGLSEQMGELNEELADSGKTLTADLRALNNQFGAVMALVIDALSLEEVDVSELVEDTSDSDISQTSQGKVQSCQNTGTVEADINVGGIAGAMAIEYDLDPEDDTTAGKRSLNTRYETKAVIQDCQNAGKITAKKNCAGGIAGRMDLGTILGGAGYGEIASTSGDYVGGIAGLSEAAVRSSVAKCTLSGRDYVGGIVGSGKNISASYALVDITEASGCVGAIAGERITGAKVADNYFVSDKWAGIGGISYAGMAEAISYEALKQKPGIPADFFTFALTFQADGQILETIAFDYGEDLSGITPPEIPAKEGCYSYWPDFDYHRATFGTVLEAVYEPWITVLASAETDADGTPLALAEGLYDNRASLHITPDAHVFADAESRYDSASVWRVTIDQAGGAMAASEAAAIRLLAPAASGKVGIWRQTEEGGWQSVPYRRKGSYLLLSMAAREEIFCLTTEPAPLAPLAAGGALLLLLLMAAAIIWRKRKGRPAPDKKNEE